MKRTILAVFTFALAIEEYNDNETNTTHRIHTGFRPGLW